MHFSQLKKAGVNYDLLDTMANGSRHNGLLITFAAKG